MNAPPKFEAFKCLKGERKVRIYKDRKVENAAIFVINKADHTIGNLVREQLFKDPKVVFSGYKMPHPLEYNIVVRVQAIPGYSPRDAFIKAIRELVAIVSRTEEVFKAELNKFDEQDD